MRVKAVLVLGASMFVVAGCANGLGSALPSASPSPVAPSPVITGPTGGPVAACAVGDWRTTEVKFSTSGPLGSGSVTGGQNVNLRINAVGQAEVDFTGMQPVSFAATIAGTSVKGSLTHAGKATGLIRTGDTTSMAGTWEPIGDANFGGVLVTLDLTEPVKLKPFDNLPLALVMNSASKDQPAGVVDTDPLLGKGRYECGSGTLTLTSEDNTGFSWKMIRKP